MEPLAPGTEDEFVMPQITKKETEKERLLSQKAYLSNGQYGNIFELSFLNGAEHWYCKVCNCPVMGRVYHHEIGKRHTNNLFANNKHLVKGDQSFDDDAEIVEQRIEIAPGEPAPPGFEDEIQKVSRIQERLNGYSVGPLVGLEYLLELQDSDISKEPSYLCILCDKKGDPRTVLTHLASYNHISQFLQKHFPTCYRALTPYMTKQFKRNWQGAIQAVAEAIERKFGRLKPMPVEVDNFEKNRMSFLEKILKGKHFYETPGNNFEELVRKEDLTKAPEVLEEPVKADDNLPFKKAPPQSRRKSPSPPVVQRPSWKPRAPVTSAKPNIAQSKKKSLSPVSSASSSDTEVNNTQKKSRHRSPVQNRGMYERRNSNRRSPTPTKTRESMPWKRPDYMKTKLSKIQDRSLKGEKNEKLEEFKKLAKAIETDMERVLKQHEKNPEKHPRYNEEWKRFWNKRYKELQFEGKDASKHDFKPEWILFWNRRMRELHDEDIKIQKEALRKRLGISEDTTPAPIRFRIGTANANAKENPQQKPVPPAACPDSDPEVIIIEDKDDAITVGSNRSGRNYKQSPSPKRPTSPRKKSPRRSRSPVRHRNRSPHKNRSPPQRIRSSPQQRSPRRMRTRSPDQRRTRSPIQRRTRSPPRQRAKSPRGSRSPKRSHSPWEAEPVSKSRKVETKSERKSLDRLSLDRISSSGSEHDFDDISKPKQREGHIKPRPRDYGIEYVRERNLDYRGLPYGRLPIQPPPWEQDRRYYYEYDEYKPPKIMRDVTREPMQDDDGNEEVNVVSVLRLLTALEEKLGSLGPKVNDLLSQALGMEKDKANSSEALLDNEVNCVLFETVKEKLKGQMLAGLIDYIQENAYKKAIKKTANLIHLANKRKEQKRESKIDPVRVPGVGTVDKAAIAKQIATALVKQGKTDVTQDELEQLINAVVGMAEASQKSDKPMTTADFIEKLSGVKKELETPKSVKKDEESFSEKCVESFSEKCVKLREQSNKPVNETVKKDKSNSNSMEHLSDSDLQTLLQNFKDLSTEEQQNLISYLKTLEAHEPERVEKLRRFVNLGMENSENSSEKKASDVIELEKPNSPFLERHGAVNPESVQKRKTVINLAELEEKATEKLEKEENKQMEKIDSDEEDYSFEDVVKAASKNVEETELAKKATEAETKKKAENEKFNETQSIITNLLSSFSKISNNSTSSETNVTAADFSKTLSSLTITVDSLANIVGNVKTMEANQRKDSTSKIDIFEDDSNSKLSNISGLHSGASNTILGDQDKLGRAFSEQANSNIGREQSFTNNLLDSVCDGAGKLNKRGGFSDQPSRLGPGLNFSEQFERPEESYQRQNQTYERPGVNFERPGPGFDRPGSGFNRQGAVFDRQVPEFGRPGPVFDRSALNFERQGPSLDRQGHGSDRPNQGFVRQGPGFNGQNPNPPFEQPDFGYEREFQSQSSPGFNFDRPGIRLPLRNDQERLRSEQVDEFDIPGPELADRRPPDFDRFGPGFGRSGHRGPGMDPASYQRSDPFVPFTNPEREQYSHTGSGGNMFRGKNQFPGPVNQNFQQQRSGSHDFGFDSRRGGFRR